MAATLIFLKLYFDNKPVAGESTALDFEQQIEVESFSWGINAKQNDKRNGRPDVRPQQVKLTKFFDKASTNLCTQMATRKKFSTARFTFISAVMKDSKEKPRPIMELVLTDGFVEQVNLSASESGASMSVREEVALSFTKLKLVYHQADLQRAVRAAPTTFDTEQPSVA